jgi:hypothetical protein
VRYFAVLVVDIHAVLRYILVGSRYRILIDLVDLFLEGIW